MAQGRVLKCSACAHAVTAWSDGNPYYRDGLGEKRYAYHPSEEREWCTGNDSPVLCLGCGAEAMSDSAAPLARCPQCASPELVHLWEVEGRTCPYCTAGVFIVDRDVLMIS